ncbi:MAG: OB-fold nucleic acid binding domain-containing protein, partial [Saccharospirillum sp.]
MHENGYPDEFIQRINRQIEGFGEYGFPESHAAGFALIAYFSSWFKCHYPEAFCCALLNSLPMGFYTASQLVQDVQRHGVLVLPVNINNSDWNSQLEWHNGKTVIRLGFSRIKGFQQSSADSLLKHRPASGFVHIKDLENIPGITTTDLDLLASASAFAELGQHRYQARWESSALQLQTPLLTDAFEQTPEQQTHLPPPNELQNLIEDYHSQGLTLGRHLITLLREGKIIPETLPAKDLLPMMQAEQARISALSKRLDMTLPDRVRLPIRVLGLVVNRQRPKSKAGVTFVTLEDDTGNINVIVWLQQAQQYIKALTTEQLVLVTGLIEKAWDNDVVHVIAQRIDGLGAASKD